MIDRASQLHRLRKLLEERMNRKAYGQITIYLEAGNIVSVEVLEREKIPLDELIERLQELPGPVKVRPTAQPREALVEQTSRVSFAVNS